MANGGSRVLAGAIVLAGCGGGGDEASPPPPAFDRSDFGALSALAPATDLPMRGGARYAGGFVADIRHADVTPSGRIEGELTLDLDFADRSVTLPIEGRLERISGEFLGQAVAIDTLPLVPGAGQLALTREGAAMRGEVTAGFGDDLALAGERRRLDIDIESPLRGPGGRALAGPVSGTILTAPFTDQPHVLTGQFHATSD